jgi:hypothetical protein
MQPLIWQGFVARHQSVVLTKGTPTPARGTIPHSHLEQVACDEPVPPRRLEPKTPRDLETVCLKCLHKEPGKRYATALELAEDLRRFQAGKPIRGRPVGVGERLLKWAKRHPTAAALLLVCVLGLLGTLAGAYFNTEQLKETRAGALAESIVTAETPDVPHLVEPLAGYRRWADPRLCRYVQDSLEDSKTHLHASLAVLPSDEGQAEYLYQRLLKAAPAQLLVIRDGLLPQREALRDRLWGVALRR